MLPSSFDRVYLLLRAACTLYVVVVLVIGGNEARPQYLQWSICDASWSTGACILSSVVGAPHTAGTTAAAASHLFSPSRTLVVPGTFLRVLYNNIHHHVAFARELEPEEKNTQQDQPAVRSAVAAAAAAAAVEKQVFRPTLIRPGAKDRPPCFVLRQSPSMPRRNCSIRREEPSIAIITADLRPFVTHTGLTVKTALFLLHTSIHYSAIDANTTYTSCDSYSSSMKGPRLNFHAERELAGHLLAVFWYHKLFAPASDCLRLVLNRQARLPTLNSRNSTTNSSSTHQPTAALQIDQSLYHTWKLCRQPGFTACSARESATAEELVPGAIRGRLYGYK